MKHHETTSTEGVLGYAVPLLARIRIARDALATGRVPLAHQTLFRSSAADVSDQLSVNEGANPSRFGSALAPTLTAAAEDAATWAVARLEACGLAPTEARILLERHVAWHLAGAISFDEIQAINRAVLSPGDT